MSTTVARLEAVLSARTDQFDKAMDRSETKMQKMGGGFRKAALPAVAALGAIGVGAKKAIYDASNLNESINAVNVVFGDASKQILAFGKSAATEAGLSMRQFNELVTPIGAALQNTGLSADVAAKSSINLAKRAADMASVFNVDVSQALGAIQAGLRGEADPLERFGVGLSAAAVTAKAMELGLADTTAALTAQDKAQARLALIMGQTDRVAGDFKSTSDQLANAQRVNAAQSENQKAKLGQGLMPVMEAYTGLVRKATAFLGEHTTATKIIVGVVAGLAVGVLAVNAALSAQVVVVPLAKAAWAGLNLVMAGNPIALTVLAIAALTAGIVIAYKRSETFRDIVNGLWGKLKGLGEWVQKNWGTISSIIEKSPMVLAFKAMASSIDDVVGGVKWLIENLGKLPKISLPFSGGGRAEDVIPGLKGDAHRTGGFNLMGASPVMAPFAAGAAAYGLQVTSGLRPGAITANGTPSDHGIGKAIDVAGSMAAMGGYFKSLIGNRSVKQAFFDPLGAIFGGLWSSYREGGHSDHVHVATYDRGGVLKPGLTMAWNGTGQNEYVSRGGGLVVNINGPVYGSDSKELARRLFDALRSENVRQGRLGRGLA